MDDCIAAISSATGEAGIGIVRMTGEGCVDGLILCSKEQMIMLIL